MMKRIQIVTFVLLLGSSSWLGAQGIVIDDGDAGFSSTGGWTVQTIAGRYGGAWQYQNEADGLETATYSFTGLGEGRYVASRSSWTQDNLSDSAVWTFSDGGGTFTQDQRVQVNHFDMEDAVAFQRFLDAGTGAPRVFDIIDGTLEVVLSDDDSARFLIADALRLERLRPDVAEVIVIGDGDPGFAETGGVWATWTGDPGDHGAGIRFSTGTVDDEIEVTFDGLAAGEYRISAAWTGGANRTSQVVLDFATSGDSGSISFDQTPGALEDDLFEEVAWQDLFETVAVADGTLTLTLSNSTGDGVLVADAFRLERLDAAGGFDDDGDGILNSWEVKFGLNPNDGSDASLDGDSDGLSNLEEFNEGTSPNDNDSDDDDLLDGVEVNSTETNPLDADSDDDGLTDGEEAGENGTGTNPLLADTDDDGQGDKEEFEAGTNPLVPNPQVVADDGGTEYLVIDNGIQVIGPGVDFRTALYEEAQAFGGQDAGTMTAWNGDRRWGNDGELMTAWWTFPSVGAGTFKVYASWNNDPQGNVGAARYTLGVGGPTVEVEQSGGTAASAALTLNDGLRSVNFVEIGEVTFGGGDFVVTVDDSVTGVNLDNSGFIFADAIAIGGSVASGPVVISDVSLGDGGAEAFVTWESTDGAAYDLEFSTDLENWITVIGGVDSQGAETSATVNLTVLDRPGKGFFRVSNATP